MGQSLSAQWSQASQTLKDEVELALDSRDDLDALAMVLDGNVFRTAPATEDVRVASIIGRHERGNVLGAFAPRSAGSSSKQ